MVSQQIDESPQGLQPSAGGLPEFRILDSTSTEQLELESELDVEAGQVEIEDVDGADAEREEAPRRGVAEAPVEQAAVRETPAPAVRTFSQDEVAKMQSAWMRQIQQSERDRVAAEEDRDRFNLDAEVESRLRQQEAQLAAQYGEEDARKIARSPDNVDAVRNERTLSQENGRLRAAFASQQVTQEQQAKGIVAQQLMSQHGLQTDDYGLLLETTSVQGMQSLARRLSNQTLANRQQRQEKLARVPAETRETALETGHSNGAAPESFERRLTRIRQKPSYEWTDSEYEFMRNGR